MSINLNDLLGNHPFLLWLVLGALLAGSWLVLPRRGLLHLAAAAVLVALVAVLWPGLGWVQVLVAVLLAAVLLLLRRRADHSPATAG